MVVVVTAQAVETAAARKQSQTARKEGDVAAPEVLRRWVKGRQLRQRRLTRGSPAEATLVKDRGLRDDGHDLAQILLPEGDRRGIARWRDLCEGLRVTGQVS